MACNLLLMFLKHQVLYVLLCFSQHDNLSKVCMIVNLNYSHSPADTFNCNFYYCSVFQWNASLDESCQGMLP